MEALVYIFSWGSHVGLGMLFLLSGAGTGLLLWGMSPLNRSHKECSQK